MKIYLCWSGDESKYIAECLNDWLPMVINAINPWLSSEDIAPGTRWQADLTRLLEETDLGILCLRKSNINNPWILLEAGALSKITAKSKVIPFLTDMSKAELSDPLAMFQAVEASKEGVNHLINTLNDQILDLDSGKLQAEQLSKAFEHWWPDLEGKLNSMPTTKTKLTEELKSDREILEEILLITRNLRDVDKNVVMGVYLPKLRYAEIIRRIASNTGITLEDKIDLINLIYPPTEGRKVVPSDETDANIFTRFLTNYRSSIWMDMDKQNKKDKDSDTE